ncbi:MAG: type II toxin-antitoxin system Phd/YefM family antitoxin [Deltaproteobacteria bacterium]|nr:type II toxin-antitoxin system Phd/YefM family antitoxin [Deltaproteobacteria bacterium]
MKPSRAIKPITYLKTNSAKLIASINSNREAVVITQNGEAMAVIQDLKTWERDRETLLMLKILSQGVAAAEKCDFIEHEKLFEQLKHKITLKKKTKQS